MKRGRKFKIKDELSKLANTSGLKLNSTLASNATNFMHHL